MFNAILLSLLLSVTSVEQSSVDTSRLNDSANIVTQSVVTLEKAEEKIKEVAPKVAAKVIDSLETTVEKVAPVSISKRVSKMKDAAIDDLISKGINGLLTYGIRVLIAIAIFFIGRWLINRLIILFRGIFKRRKMDRSFASFLINLIYVASYVALILMLVHIVGFESTSFVALLASTGVGIGMAMSGTLQNFAGGVLILFTRPYRVGDVIEAMNQIGTVHEIQLFHTVITTPDNKIIMIPNGTLSSGIVNNYTKGKTRRVEWKLGIAYGDDFDSAKAFIASILEEDVRVLKTLPYDIAIDTFADSSVIILVRAWTGVDDFLSVKWHLNERFYKEHPRHGLSIPFPQLDVKIKKE